MFEELQILDATPEEISAVVLDFIERSLPDMVAHLSIPDPMPTAERRHMETQLTVRRGFRVLSKQQRNRIAVMLEQDNLVRIIRVAQEETRWPKERDASGRLPFPGDMERGTSFAPLAIGSSSALKLAKTELVSGASAEQLPSEFARRTEDLTLEGLSPDEQRLGSAQSSPHSSKKSALPLHVDRYELESLAGTDVRQSIALLSKGKLVKVLPRVPESLLPELEYIEIPNRDMYAALSYSSLYSGYQRIASGYRPGDPLPVDKWTELRLIDALLSALEIEERWAALNNRRFHLINKKHTQGLGPEEQQELDQLQDLASQRMDAIAPLPFATLIRVEEFARKAGLTLEQPLPNRDN
jgi:hypothetical protein